ncbi:hypothetical protein NKI94_29735 [Mesorhizobium australicum]|uniref:Uncharacterized protein n=1 Tax=Mesorhizobium australicum TaxID=536018 RepID=A0ACC6T115_9HYPH
MDIFIHQLRYETGPNIPETKFELLVALRVGYAVRYNMLAVLRFLTKRSARAKRLSFG